MPGFQRRDEDGTVVFHLEGALERDAFGSGLGEAVGETEGDVVLDLDGVGAFDSAGLAALIDVARGAGDRLRFRGVDGGLVRTLGQLRRSAMCAEEEVRPARGFLDRVGAASMPALEAFRGFFDLLVEAFYWCCVAPFQGRPVRGDRVRREIERTGADAIWIISLLGVLMGVTLTFQASVQMRDFGATAYVADLVGVSLTRVLGPLMAAIVVAARSGSANTAEIGTMVVSEEVDALRQMGLAPMRWLVVPKIVALGVVLPFLGLWMDSVGIVSSAVIASHSLDLPANIFMARVATAVATQDILIGLLKCSVFGVIIGTVSCGQGLRVRGGADEVGRSTTSAVVVAILLVILAEAFFAMVVQS